MNIKTMFSWAVERAKSGNFIWLNVVFKRVLPFNAPHGIKISGLNEDQVQVALPSRRANQNHLKGMHACAMATACEFCSGIAVLIRFDMTDYRLIMNRLEVEYLRRPAPGDCMAVADIPDDLAARVNAEIDTSQDGASRFVLPSRLLDSNGEVVAEAQVHWHVKPWSRVRHRG
jgi:acyl-coenzyme A thioesterase PaaI-like protein